jgi:imidazolonepropionase-like amidohydrolase
MTIATRTVIRPHLLLDVVTGELLADRAVVIEGRRIVAVAAAGDAPAEGAAFVDLPSQTLLPGMIDCHTHLVGEPDSGHGYAALLTRTGAQEALSGVRNARNTLLAGFTTVRDVGTFRAFVDVALRDAIDQGWVPGPRMRVAGAYVTCSGGGGDITGLAPDVDAVVPHEFRVGVADSVDDMRRAVRRVLHGGADLVKLIATGAVMAPGGVPGAPELTEEQIQAAVEEAALSGADVAAHAHGAEGIKRAVRGGVRSIEHGSLMDDESIEMMAAAGTFLVADVYNGDYIAQTGREQGWRADVLAKNDQTTLAQREGFTKCLAADVRIAFGTDSGIYPHGLGARQFAYQVRCGQSPLGAIQSATLHAAELIRWDDRVGRIAPGYLADIIAVNGNPLQDIRLLENTSFIMKDGTIHRRGPDTPPAQPLGEGAWEHGAGRPEFA